MCGEFWILTLNLVCPVLREVGWDMQFYHGMCSLPVLQRQWSFLNMQANVRVTRLWPGFSWWEGIVVAYHWQNKVNFFPNDVAAEEQCLFFAEVVLPLGGLLSFQHLFWQAVLQKAPYMVGAMQHQRGELHYICHRPNHIQPSVLQGFLLWTRMPYLFLAFSYIGPEMGQGGLGVSLNTYLPLPFFFPLPKEGPDLMSPVVFHLHFNCHKLAVQRGTVGGFKLPWSSTSPKYIFSLWKLISWPPWSVV